MLVQGGGQFTAFHPEFSPQAGKGYPFPCGNEGIQKGRLVPEPRQFFRRVLGGDCAVIFRGFGDGGGGHRCPYRITDGAERVFLQEIAQRQHFAVQCRTGGQGGENRLHILKIAVIPQGGDHGGDFAVGVAVRHTDQHTDGDPVVHLRWYEIIVGTVCVVGNVQNVDRRKQFAHNK